MAERCRRTLRMRTVTDVGDTAALSRSTAKGSAAGRLSLVRCCAGSLGARPTEAQAAILIGARTHATGHVLVHVGTEAETIECG